MTKIEWTHMPGFKGETLNPFVGCGLASPGCTNCYAMRMAARLELMGTAHYAGLTEKVNGKAVWSGKIKQAPETTLMRPLRWKKPRCIFVNSMGDLFHENVTDEMIDRVFAIAALCPQHIFIILTKRSARMREYLTDQMFGFRMRCHMSDLSSASIIETSFPISNIWLGVSVEDQKRADERIPDLLATPAAKRFVSCEPLLGPVDMESDLGGTLWIGGQRGCGGRHQHAGTPGIEIHGRHHKDNPREPHHHHDNRCKSGLDWVITGGESGPGARPAHPDWFRSLRDQCAVAGVPYFFKQWGEWCPATFHYDADDGWIITPAIQNTGDKDINGAVWSGHRWCSPWEIDVPPDTILHGVARIGKKLAGNMLDGVHHLEFPEVI